LDETLSGASYGGQRYEITLFPQQDGRISVPAIPVEVDIRRWGEPGGDESRQMKTPAVAFDVRIPPGAERLQGLISTTELAAQQQWTPAAREFKVGDALERTIALAAPDISGMAFPPLEFPAVDGLGIYPGEPAVDDSYARGSLQGKRTESVTYVFEKEGAFELPAIEIPWWDAGRKQLKTAVLPALKVEIAAASGPGAGAAGENGAQAGPDRRLLVLVLLPALVAGAAWWFRAAIRSRWQAWRRARRGTEQALFRRFREACRQNDAMAAYQRLVDWLGHPEFDFGVATVKDLQGVGGREKLAREVTGLEGRLFKKPEGRDARPPWQGETLYRELARWRKRFVKTKGATSPEEGGLAPLNPN
jgi:hypothetical protein